MRRDVPPKVVPTRYAGVNFRSRLEATWAVFFDSIGLPWRYEPFDLEGWTPDFLLQDDILCEVKPEVDPKEISYSGSPYLKSIGAWHRGVRSGHINFRQYLAIGLSPIPHPHYPEAMTLGTLLEPSWPNEDNRLPPCEQVGPWDCTLSLLWDGQMPGEHLKTNSWRGRIHSDRDGYPPGQDFYYSVEGLWLDAQNATQSRARKPRRFVGEPPPRSPQGR